SKSTSIPSWGIFQARYQIEHQETIEATFRTCVVSMTNGEITSGAITFEIWRGHFGCPGVVIK
ncbi:MAG TPA: hypothetical protein VN223_07550, partial [Candidatus Elarobacter sp.]|nr:hypothetical protein [Candidatus Elarobacter sp.]